MTITMLLSNTVRAAASAILQRQVPLSSKKSTTDCSVIKLADALTKYRGTQSAGARCATRRGARWRKSIADRLGGEVDVVLVRKLGAPSNPEFAIGAVDESGR